MQTIRKKRKYLPLQHLLVLISELGKKIQLSEIDKVFLKILIAQTVNYYYVKQLV